jgi:predicted transcriptional regulator
MSLSTPTLSDIVARCSLDVLAGRENLARPVSAAFASDLMSDVLAFSTADVLLVTGLTNRQTVVTAEISDALGILYTRGKRPDPESLERAAGNGMPILSTDLDTFTICGLLYEMGVRGNPRGAGQDRR